MKKVTKPAKQDNRHPDNAQQAISRMDRFLCINWMVERPYIATDGLRFLLGNEISHGEFRIVHEFDFNKSLVIKFAPDSFDNVMEYKTWEAIKTQPYAKWFAPCIDISPCGHYLLQKRITPIKEGEALPKQIPQFFDDIKLSNFGWLKDQFVCCDYQFVDRLYDIAANTQLRKINWKEVKP